jgi:hypothetical protein
MRYKLKTIYAEAIQGFELENLESCPEWVKELVRSDKLHLEKSGNFIDIGISTVPVRDTDFIIMKDGIIYLLDEISFNDTYSCSENEN